MADSYLVYNQLVTRTDKVLGCYNKPETNPATCYSFYKALTNIYKAAEMPRITEEYWKLVKGQHPPPPQQKRRKEYS